MPRSTGTAARALLAAALGAALCGGPAAAAPLPAVRPYGGAADKAPWFCHGIECPDFSKVESGSDSYEERTYPAANWTSTTVKGVDLDKGLSTGFMRLFHYIGGDNELGTKIDMTAPVTSRIVPGQGPVCESNFTISFYVPTKYQSDPPKGTSPDVFTESREAMTVYVKSFKGYAKSDDILKKAVELEQELSADGKEYEMDYIFYAGYDSPFRIFNRHNEVWIVAKAPAAAEAPRAGPGGGFAVNRKLMA